MGDLRNYLLAPVKAAEGTLRAVWRRFYSTIQPSREPGKQQQAAIQKTTRLTLLENIPAVTYVLEIGEPSAIIYFSPQVEAMLGYPPYVFEKDPAHWIKVLHPEDRERILAEKAWAGSTGPDGLWGTGRRLARSTA